MTIVIPRFLIGAAVAYGAMHFLGPTVFLWCLSVAIGIYLLIKLTHLLMWLGSAGFRGIVAGIKRAMRANYRAIALATPYGLLAGLLGGVLVAVAMGVTALPFIGLALLSKDLIVWAVFGWFFAMFVVAYVIALNEGVITKRVAALREQLLFSRSH